MFNNYTEINREIYTSRISLLKNNNCVKMYDIKNTNDINIKCHS